ncbi:F-box domain-containing protein [Caenorhabditis elegans]|uniref:F-box domain-containing protein n=1 Tax=Caenorhabditis elegans TaxID=6239 RepID=O16696_CAEEL|nr:F-box domain-containing protein [Caenorhabditis elegans]CCD69475.2 F-box domain-containing protein [Caenorhabditis elegans]
MPDSSSSNGKRLNKSSNNSASIQQINPKAKYIVKDPRALRLCILFQHLQGVPVFNAYKAMNKTYGDNFMEYRHFEYWYMGIANGSLTVDSYDRFYAFERKKFTDFSNFVQRMVLDMLNPIDRFAARAVCRNFRCIIDNQRSALKKIEMTLKEESVDLNVNDGTVFYHDDFDKGCTVNYKKRKLFVTDKKPLEVAMDDVLALLSGRDVSMDYFGVILAMGKWQWAMVNPKVSFKAIHDALQLIGILSAKSVSLDCAHTDQVVSLLKHFEPETLESLHIEILEFDEDSVKELVILDQWEEAKTLSLTTVAYFSLIVKHLYHFESLKFNFLGETFLMDDIIKFRDEILLKSSVFKSLTCESVDFDARMFVRVFDPNSSRRDSSGSIAYKTKKDTFIITYQPNAFNIKKKIDSEQ